MSFDCEQYEDNLDHCNCTYPGCPRKGNCCQCLQYHLGRDELPACVFPDEIEKSYDRSFEKFIEVSS
ncbi:MAG: DUF6485 family protein [Candidatus Bipolaricaulota bacterium]